jgi:hypothetical protein
MVPGLGKSDSLTRESDGASVINFAPSPADWVHMSAVIKDGLGRPAL